MDKIPLSRNTSRSSFQFVEKRLSSLSFRRQSSETAEEIRGPLGLTLLHAPAQPLVDFIFVHGLRGGSRKTWSYSDDPYHFWPQEWLPRDPDFKHVRIHSFGYNSDWSDTRESQAGVHDFGKSLLGDMQNSPRLRKVNHTPIVLIGHSLGGLVIKKAYILAKQDPTYQNVAKRLHSVFFLATPHRGASKAQLLNSILKTAVSHSSKFYVTDLEPQSAALQVINDEFRLCYHGTQLWSFYETLKTPLGYNSVLLVERDSAIIGLPEERTQPLNADHRRICKFEKPTDGDFMTLRNAFVSTIEPIIEAWTSSQQHKRKHDLKQIARFLAISDWPEEELSFFSEERTPGTCEWLTSKASFQAWVEDTESCPKYFWLSGSPATGKSILASHVIEYLQMSGRDCCYFFLKHNDEARASIDTLLRSMAYQMASLSAEIREALNSLQADDTELKTTQLDDRATWRKLFLTHIFKIDSHAPMIWVIDGLDECTNPSLLVSILSKIDSNYPLRVFFTSRISQDLEKVFASIAKSTVSEHMEIIQAQGDIRKYVEANMERLPIQEEFDRAQLVEKIVANSNGCFLWAHLVLQELEQTYSEEQIMDVLNEVPKEMDPLYHRILQNLSSNSRSKDLIKAVLKWIVCATRPLDVEELKEALKLDIGANVPRLEKMIQSILGHLVYIDRQSKVSLIHKTARDFLLDEGLESEFAIVRREAHTQLATTCLKYLLSDEMEPPRQFRQSGNVARLTEKSIFVDYATVAFSDHLARSMTSVDIPLELLNRFLQTNILSWIEYIATGQDLSILMATARNLRTYLKRRAKQRSPLGQIVRDVESWAADLVHLGLGFGSNLVEYPPAIHALIPPLCPTESAIYRGFAKNMPNPRSFKIKGLSFTTWNDRMSCFVYHNELTSALACRDGRFAVGLSKGTIMVYSTATCRVTERVDHGERVICVQFGTTSELLASAGRKIIRLWNVSTGHEMWHMESSFGVLALWFDMDDTLLSAATRGNHVASWSVNDGSSRSVCTWHDTSSDLHLDGKRVEHRRSPTSADFSTELQLLAIVYRGLPVILWDFEEEIVLGSFERPSASDTGQLEPSTSAVGLAFSSDPYLRLLAIAYQDGDLAIIDPITQELKAPIIVADAQILAGSPDGKTLVTGDAAGTIKIFEFSTLGLLHRISFPGYDVKALIFDSDGLRFYDIRGPQCNVWQPDMLVRKSADDKISDASSEIAPETLSSDAGWHECHEETAIVAIAVCARGDYVICATDDGCVWVYDAEDGKQLQKLFHQPLVNLMHWNSAHDLLAVADFSSRVRVTQLTRESTGQWIIGEQLIDYQSDQSICQIILNGTGDRFLVSTEQVDTVWDLQGQQISSRTSEDRTPRHFSERPGEPSEVLLFTRDKVEVFEWASLEKISSHSVQVCNETQSIAQLRTHKGAGSLRALVLESIESEHSMEKRILSLWNPQNFNGTNNPAEAEILYPRIIANAVAVLGIFQALLVFLNPVGWVCTVDLEHRMVEEYTRHFIIPASWRSVGREFVAQVTAKGDVLVVQGKELAVAKNMMSNRTILIRAKDL